MPKKSVKKFRGTRTCGGGTHKNRRGAGSHGGRGNAGSFKHHIIRARMRGQLLGNYGFHRPTTVKMDFINVGDLERMTDENGHVDLGLVKVLGKGKLSKKLTVSAAGFSVTAKEKITAVGGEVVVA